MVPPLVGLFYVAVAEPSARSISKGIAHEILAALKDPLALFSQRSPGKRIAGHLLSTKGKGGPHERVLSTVRDREQPPAVDTPVPDSVAAIPIIPPQYEIPPTDRTVGALPFVPPAPFIPTGFVPGGFLPPSQPPTTTPPGPPGGPPGTPPGLPPGTPPGGPPEGPPTPPDTPPVIPIPEPSTWTLMLLGFFALVAVGRRRMRKPQTGG
jgi:hypothetical protein